MAVGMQATAESMDQNLSSLAVQMRNLMQAVSNLNTSVNGQAAGLAYMESIGYASTPNQANPGGLSDAQYALEVLAYLNQPAGVYYGAVQSGGSGGTGAVQFNINNALAPVWGGQ